MIFSRFLVPALALLFGAHGSNAQTVPIGSLGALQLDYVAAHPVQHYPAEPVAARVVYRPGQAELLIAPMQLAQIDYLLGAGAEVEQGQPFAELRGMQVHHLELARESGDALLKVAQSQYTNSQSLHRSNAISDSQLLEAAKEYYAALAEYEHLRHFFAAVQTDGAKEGVMQLIAPVTGVLVYGEPNPSALAMPALMPSAGDTSDGQLVASFVPATAIRLQAQLPIAIASDTERLATPQCVIALERVDALVNTFFVNVWSESLPQACNLTLGQHVVATPQLRTDASRIPMTAVFDWQGTPSVLLRANDTLVTTGVTVVATDGNDYIVTAQTSLTDAQVLVSSVSAVQGLLLGMGGE